MYVRSQGARDWLILQGQGARVAQHRLSPHPWGTAAGRLKADKASKVQGLPRGSSPEQKEMWLATGLETRLQHGSKVHPGARSKDRTADKLQPMSKGPIKEMSYQQHRSQDHQGDRIRDTHTLQHCSGRD